MTHRAGGNRSGSQTDTSRRLRAPTRRLQLPVLDLDEVGRLLDDFETRFESHSNPE